MAVELAVVIGMRKHPGDHGDVHGRVQATRDFGRQHEREQPQDARRYQLQARAALRSATDCGGTPKHYTSRLAARAREVNARRFSV